MVPANYHILIGIPGYFCADRVKPETNNRKTSLILCSVLKIKCSHFLVINQPTTFMYIIIRDYQTIIHVRPQEVDIS